MDGFCETPLWNTTISWNTTQPDLTPCFHDTVLTWIPCGVLLLLAPLDIWRSVTSKNPPCSWNFVNVTNTLVCIFLCMMVVFRWATLVYTKLLVDGVSSADLYAPPVRFGAIAVVICLSLFARWRGVPTSLVIPIFWLAETVSASLQLRSDVLVSRSTGSPTKEGFLVMSYLYFVLVVFQLLITGCLQGSGLDAAQLDGCPMTKAPFFSRMFFFWMSGTFLRGLRAKLTPDTLLPMCGQLKCASVSSTFEKSLTSKQERSIKRYSTNDVALNERTPLLEQQNKSKQSQPKPVHRSLLFALFCTGGRNFSIGCIYQLVSIAVGYVPPFALHYLLDYLTNGELYWHGYVYMSAFYFGAVLARLADVQYQHYMNATAIQVKSALIAAVYKKMFRLSSDARRSHTSGKIINLMSIDTEEVFQFTQFSSQLWAIPVRFVVSLYILWQILGPSCLVGMVIIICMGPLTVLVARKCDTLQLKRMAEKDERLKIINEILNGIKVLKLYSWERPFMQRVQNTRKKELGFLNHSNMWSTSFSFIWLTAPLTVALGSFAAYVLVDDTHVLDPSSAFVSLTVFGLLRFPMGALPDVLAKLVRARVALQRLKKFLSSEELDNTCVGYNPPPDCAISFENGTFAWGPDQDPTLKNVTFHVKKGSLIAVVGAVGSGKTSLFSAVLGEMEKISGSVNIKGSVAYVSQQAWIQNATLRQNVLFSSEMKNEEYSQIVEACTLKPDLEMLPGSDHTEIGEKGINLSGGQKQRVSLARAVYQDKDIYLLDDCLSAVDAHVASHLFQNVIGPEGLLCNKTRLLLTHNISILPDVDYIIVLEGGTIVDQGTYAELTRKGRTFAEYLQQPPEDDTSINKDVPPEDKYQHIKHWDFSVLSHQESTDPTADHFHRLMEDEKLEIGKVNWRVYWQYFRTSGICRFILTLISASLFCACEMGAGVWLSQWSMDQLTPSGKQDTKKRALRILVFALLILGQGISAVLTAWFLFISGIKASSFLHKRLISRLLKAPLSFFDTTPMGRILNRFSRDIEAIDVEIPMYLNFCITIMVWIPGAFIVLSLVSPYLLAAFVPLAILYYIIQSLYVVTTRQLRRLTSVLASLVYSCFSESLSGISSIRAFKVQKRFIEGCQSRVDKHLNSYFLETAASRWMEASLYMLGGLVILATAVLAVLTRDDVNSGLAGLALTYSLEITDSFCWMVRNISQLETSVVALERVEEYSQIAQESGWAGEEKIPPHHWPQNGDIKIWELSTTYRAGLEPVLRCLTVHIRSGEKVGVVGRTGAGKSSLVLCLFRIIEPIEGAVSIDGIDISLISLHDLRSRLAVIPQDPVVFAGTLRMNLDPWNDYNDKEIWVALELAHLKQFVQALPGGLHYDLAEGGENLSTGQRQLVCLARALLRKSKILILDEATASVDVDTDQLIQSTIRQAFLNCTLITIAHRLHTILDYDRIIVMSNGEIVEDDTPEALMHDTSSQFHSMAKDAGLVIPSPNGPVIDVDDILSGE